MFNNKRYITKGVSENISLPLQLILWNLIDTMVVDKKDYLQVFTMSEENGHQKIIHTQEEPPYQKEYLIKTDTPFLCNKIFVIDDSKYSTMLLSGEY